MAKGDKLDECYRTVCKDKPAIYYNHSTQKYYCPNCAHMINQANHNDAMRLYGHSLCTIDLTPIKQ